MKLTVSMDIVGKSTNKKMTKKSEKIAKILNHKIGPNRTASHRFRVESSSILRTLQNYVLLLLLLFIPTFLVTLSTADNNSTIGLPSCPTTCGNITVPYPFGIEPGCYRDGFHLTCDQTQNPSKLFLGDGSIQVFNISILEGIVHVKSNVLTVPGLQSGNMLSGISNEGPYSISIEQTRLTAIGCNIIVKITNRSNPLLPLLGMCASVCMLPGTLNNSVCYGVGCCQTSVPFATKYFEVDLTPLNGTNTGMVAQQNNVFLVEQNWFANNLGLLQNKFDPFSKPQPQNDSLLIPFVLDWSLSSQDQLSCDDYKKYSSYGCLRANSTCYSSDNFRSYRCKCIHGFQGNPYIQNGCQDINECELPDVYPCYYGECINEAGAYRCSCDGWGEVYNGSCPLESETEDSGSSNGRLITIIVLVIIMGLAFIFLVPGVIMLIKRIKKRRLKITRGRWFKQNHGLLLQQLISSNGLVGERMKILSLEELKKATNKFHANRVVGHGGHGIVYKGILSDQRIVAIKKSQIVVRSEIDQFINELAILSQIDHRNVVKLYGCCLDSEVPLLVYEFISNGTLFNHLHVEGCHLLSWESRFRIAVEIARALAHLHSTASISIFHRDVKSSNILLDNYLTAKVSDFGASRLIQINHTGITTAVQGTFGYLDPEYFQTGRLTEKSDVYSFGVILAEVLTREKPISSSRFQQGENLALYFCSAMRESNLNKILDPEIIGDEHRVEILTVALLAETCLRIKGEERPTMKEIDTRFQVWNTLKKRELRLHPWREERSNERESVVTQLVGDDNSRQYSLESKLVASYHFRR